MVSDELQNDFLESPPGNVNILRNMNASIILGLIVGNRGFFPAHLCDAGRKQILATLEKAGIGTVVLPTTADAF